MSQEYNKLVIDMESVQTELNGIDTLTVMKSTEDDPLDLREFYEKKLGGGNELYRAKLLKNNSCLHSKIDKIIDLKTRHNLYMDGKQ